MDIKEIVKYLEENKESPDVKAFISTLTQPKELSFEQLMKNEDFAKQIRSFADSESSKAVDAFKEKGFKKAVETGVSEALEAKEKKTPHQIEVEELNKRLNAVETENQEKELKRLRSDNKVKAINFLKEKTLPSDMLDFLVSEESEKTDENVNIFATMMEDYGQAIKQGQLKGNNTFVPSSPGNNDSLQEPGVDASKEEWKEYYAKQKE